MKIVAAMSLKSELIKYVDEFVFKENVKKFKMNKVIEFSTNLSKNLERTVKNC